MAFDEVELSPARAQEAVPESQKFPGCRGVRDTERQVDIDVEDLADGIALIRASRLPAAFANELHPYVRERFQELWQAAQSSDAP